jgi:sugar phosphate isomerase/epimerase
MKTKIYYSFVGALIIALSAFSSKMNTSSSTLAKEYPETKLGWKLGSQAYTFKNFTFVEALRKIDSCDLKYVEGSSVLDIGGGIAGKLDYHMSAATREQVLQKMKERGIKMAGYGVSTGTSEADWRQLFDFAKAMGIETITSEPKLSDMPLLSKLCDEYKINIAIHNHPKPSPYWNPEAVLSAIKGQSSRIGSCADIGHWVRSGLDPVECLKKLNGHVLHSHMKDLNEKGVLEAHDVIWGTGVSNIAGVVQELKRQHFKGMISAEYEYHWNNSGPEVAASAANLRKMLQ